VAAFMFVEIKVKDAAVYEDYMARIPPVIAKYEGRYVVRSSKVTPVAGGWAPDRLIVMEFASVEALRKCFQSSEYKELAVLREQATATRSVMVED
jgi:uncharacterized protein (DUF1330 family)